MNRPLEYSNVDKNTKVAIAIIAPIGAIAGCGTIVVLGFIAMVGIYVYFAQDGGFPTAELLNKTGKSLTILWDGQSRQLPDGNNLKLLSRRSLGFKIQTESGEKWRYELASASIDGTIYIHHFHLQIEPDGSLYLLHPKPPWQPKPKVRPQPNGYPLHPIPDS